MAVNGFMLSTMILESPADIRDKSDQEHIAEQQDDFQQPSEECIADRSHACTFQNGFKAGRKRHKQSEG